LLQEQHRNLEEMREMSASRASMSLMDLSNVGIIDDLVSPPAAIQQSTPLVTSPNPTSSAKMAVAKQLFNNVSIKPVLVFVTTASAWCLLSMPVYMQ
jgi:hypothetical protein